MNGRRVQSRVAALERYLTVWGPCPRCRERRLVVMPEDGGPDPARCPQCGRSPLTGPVKVYIGVRVADV